MRSKTEKLHPNVLVKKEYGIRSITLRNNGETGPYVNSSNYELCFTN